MGKLYRYRIGTGIHAITYDESKYELEVGGLRVDIQLKPLQVLSALLKKTGEIVTREELFAEVWHGRPTVDNVLPNAITKLRNALGSENSGLIENTPRVGYRFTGHFARVAVGQDLASRMALAEGQSVPNRPGYALQRLLGSSHGYEAWLARHRETGDLRVYKFAEDAQALAGLKREATLSRVLRDRLGERPDIVRMLGWSFDESPFFLESEYGGQNLLEWHRSGDRLGSLDERARVDLFLKIAGAVAAAHSVGVLHKDIKPANILVAPDGDAWRVRLADFGSGRLIDPERLEQIGITALGMTVTDGLSMDETHGTLITQLPSCFAINRPPFGATSIPWACCCSRSWPATSTNSW